MSTATATRSTSPRIWRAGIGIATGVVLVAILLLWAVAVPLGPEACALMLPGPRNCFTIERVIEAQRWSVAIVAAYLTTIAVLLTWTRRRVSSVAAIVMLCLVGVSAYLAVAWIPAWAHQADEVFHRGAYIASNVGGVGHN